MLLVKNEFGQVLETKLAQDLSVLAIEHTVVKAKISLYGGQVLSWHPDGEKEVFWLSKDSLFEQGKAIRGGIPLCWPWFGAHPNDNAHTAGNHGFVRMQQWQVVSIDISEQGVEVTLSWQGEAMNELWPNACQLKQVLFFGRSFKQTLQMTNLGDADAYYTGALHSYFRVSAPAEIKIAALGQADYYDKLTEQLCKPQVFKNGVGPVDRIYHSNKDLSLVDYAWGRTLELKSQNTKQWVFWNPGVEAANKMADVHPNGEQEFVCLEAATTEMQLLPAGGSKTITQEISIVNHE
ncbi:D-hexose-6-phosphate mutarotase [Colwellia sp. 1_MG-2023]|uniref:D-hexose-6-phosphate mutarotase n=1 Tax=unclassified Colwellia TaxID=196834 RepID=UPI001C09DD7E|nr:MULTISPECIES: D-hexose-6-phosphate mutarotase [unclassified Colwellia]MBU2923855.1 D-hexose-6-phosphate mutarotase [Colwellia sp. C2M11]MDO6653073.1 D-hexose-6-phosphate mutarotase [Colwellia sp. 3_MG-2023]MDO6665940.1 D-hexose-6-phosphate mutarotase [Colwellia sp. 2_MG-2023]MDO6690313.1 D-hexose-6-phosphate mutarotase [Colwellia sp. 1_MG-2023]